MKKLVGMIAAAAVLIAAGTAYAHCGSCATDKAKAGGCPVSACSKALGKMDLSADQKAKVAALKEAFDKAGGTPEACAKYMKGLESVLTKEQLAQCKAACGKTSDCCPSAAAGSGKN